MSPFELTAPEGVRPGCGHRKEEIALTFGELESTTHLLLWLHDPMPEKLLQEELDLDSTICHLAGSGIRSEGVLVSVMRLPASWRMHRGLDITQALPPALGHRKGSPVLSIAGSFHRKNQ